MRLCAAAVALLCAANTAQAGLFEDDEARRAILDLRQRVERLNDDNAQMRRGMLDLQSQIEAMRAELAALRGQQEQLGKDTSDLQRRQKDLTQGIDARLSKIEPVKVSVDGREFSAEPGEKQAFDNALSTLRNGDFTGAQSRFTELLRAWPKSGYRPSALFWLANAQYANRSYAEAIANFRAMLGQFDDHARAPEALLAIANCQIELKDTKSARRTLGEVIQRYPQSEAAGAARDRLAALK